MKALTKNSAAKTRNTLFSGPNMNSLCLSLGFQATQKSIWVCVHGCACVHVCVWQAWCCYEPGGRWRRREQTTWQLLFCLQKTDEVAQTQSRSLGKSVISRRDGNKTRYSQNAGCRPLELSCKLHVRNANTGRATCHLTEEHNANLLFLSLLSFFFFWFCFVLSKCSGTCQKE